MAKKPASSSPDTTRFTDTKRVKDLVALMAENGLTEIELVEDKARIVLRRGSFSGAPAPAAGPIHYAPPTQQSAPQATSSTTPPAINPDEGLIPIKSPMVGTFYSSPNPESDPFVSAGTDVSKDKTVVCIIEAMKVFNEIHADATGTVAKVLVSNGQAVEYGQPLFLIKPS